jgi:hypothetical protein
MFLSANPGVTVTVAWRWLGVIWLYLVLLLWHRMTAGDLPIIVAAWLFSFLLISLMVGDLFLKWALRDSDRFNNLPTKLLSGILCVNVFLFIASLVLPFHLAVDWIIFLILVLILWSRVRRVSFDSFLSACHMSETFFFLAIPLAVTAWCLELLHPIKLNGEVAVIRAWPDVYYHICQITAFASSKGAGTISDVQMVDSAVHLYHMASYMLPAVLVDVTGSSALVAYASLLVPLGILMTALAAYSLCHIVFGKWPALAAGLALMLLPDATQQGFGNPFFGYHWLQQIAPAGSYGVASAAFVFMLMFEACRTTQYRLIILGYFFVFVTLLFKAQIFVAISFTALVFPVLFMGGRVANYRVPLLLLLTCIYLGVIALSQTSLSVPVMRLDGSGLTTYSSLILSFQTDGFIKQTFTSLFVSAGNNWYLRAGVFVLMMLICIFGFFPVLYAVLLRHLKRCFNPVVWLFPLMVLTVYLVMASCLALDDRHIGTPEELLHRPFVWAYFVLVVWCSGATYHRLFGDALPVSRQAKWSFVLFILFLAIVPISFGKGISTFKSWGLGYQELPVCQLEAARFIRENSHVDEVVQDAINDNLVLFAFSERKSFAIDSGGVRLPVGIQSRLNSLKRLKELKDGNEVESFMKENAIRWYLTNPMDNVQWAEAMMSHVVFGCGGYRVYHF